MLKRTVDTSVDIKSRKQGQIDTSELFPNLAEIVTVWPELPGPLKAAIKALIQTHIKEAE